MDSCQKEGLKGYPFWQFRRAAILVKLRVSLPGGFRILLYVHSPKGAPYSAIDITVKSVIYLFYKAFFREVIKIELNIVLVEPRIPQNTGNIARTCALTGARLHIVKPMGFEIDDRQLKRAGLDYWHLLDITYYEGLSDFFDKNKTDDFIYFTTKAVNNYCDVKYNDKVYIVFGREDAGLPEELLYENKDSCVRIPMIDNEAARSLNLSNSVAIAAYEVLRQWGFPELKNKGSLTKYKWQ